MCVWRPTWLKTCLVPVTIPCAIPLYSHHPLPSSATHTYGVGPSKRLKSPWPTVIEVPMLFYYFRSVPLGPDQVLLRGAHLRNTQWIFGKF